MSKPEPMPRLPALTQRSLNAPLFGVPLTTTALVLQEKHINTCYKHFYYFVREFNLITPKELEPLSELTKNLTKGDK